MSLRNFILRAISRSPYQVTNTYYRLRNSWRPATWENAPFFLIHVPKTAGSSIAEILDISDPGHILFSEMSARQRMILVNKPCLAVLRDPAARLLSTFNYMHTGHENNVTNLISNLAGGSDINTFIVAQHRSGNLENHYFLRPAASYIESARAFGANVEVVEFRNFVRNPAPTFAKVGLDFTQLPKANRSTKTVAQLEDITAESMQIIRDVYHKDYKLLECH